ncbi:tRNA (adenosine(37)-N6)-threonylcarbamoyltransferase complex ATPase subunit type 1 TsaE [Bartonella sp. DGB1]|uniref:tRNA (adenosine(37)-N6)-threonylcarbamoyltransferase complex ATPase subunit type 1 TsaE n=1 Tax=Bartonella sp. DGB1 TaxID=3239807 RepID=UPI0035261953
MKYQLYSEENTKELAQNIAKDLQAGDFIFLSGDLGSGKTTFSRYLIQNIANDTTIEVVSPTFPIIQYYDNLPQPIIHADFYRLEHEDEIEELGLDSYLLDAIFIIEWPEIGQKILPLPKYHLNFKLHNNSRYVTILK